MYKRHPKKIYIGLVGEKGGGKDTVMKFVQKLLPKKKIVQIRFSDVLSETLDLWVLPKTRANYQKLSPMMVDTYGVSTLANIVRHRAENANANVVFLNGVRWWADVRMLRKLNNPRKSGKSVLIYVTAPARVRYERLRKRGEKAGEKNATFRQFMREEMARSDADIPKIGRKADVIIGNTGTMDEFSEAVKARILPLITGKKP